MQGMCAGCDHEVSDGVASITCGVCRRVYHKACGMAKCACHQRRVSDVLQHSVGKNAELITGAHGGVQSQHEFRLDMFPRALLCVGHVCYQGNITHEPKDHTMFDTMEPIEPNWHKIPARDHFNRCMVHLQAYMAGDRTDDHLGHAACRALFGLEVHLLSRENANGVTNAQEEKQDDTPSG